MTFVAGVESLSIFSLDNYRPLYVRFKSEDDHISEHLKCGKEQRSEADIELRAFLTKTFREHRRLSKPQIAEKLSEILGEPVSLSRLDSYTASTKASSRLPAYFLRALAEVLDSDEILLFLARPRIRAQVEFSERVRELRAICDELLADAAGKPRGSHALAVVEDRRAESKRAKAAGSRG